METTKKRGRPKKIVEEPMEFDTPLAIVANVLAEWCSIPNCGTKIHRPEAEEILSNLVLAGYRITKGGE